MACPRGGKGTLPNCVLYLVNIYGNTVFVSPSIVDGGVPPGIEFKTDYVSDIGIYNNVILTSGGSPVLNLEYVVPQLTIAGNAYWSYNSPLRIQWLGSYSLHSSPPRLTPI